MLERKKRKEEKEAKIPNSRDDDLETRPSREGEMEREES